MVSSSWKLLAPVSVVLATPLSASGLNEQTSGATFYNTCSSPDQECEYLSILQNHVRRSSTLTSPDDGSDEQKGSYVDFSDELSAGPAPRYSSSDPKVLLWSGDDRVTQSATTVTKPSQLEELDNGDYKRVAETAPGCAAECQTGTKCVTMDKGYGRLGNILDQLFELWYVLDASTWSKGTAISTRYMPIIFDFPEYICLNNLSRFHPRDGSTVKRELAPECRSADPVRYRSICGQMDSLRQAVLTQEYITPYFSNDLKQCIAQKRPIDEDKLLTIHLRGEDIFGESVHAEDYAKKIKQFSSPIYFRIARQPVCHFYEKLISESEWEHVLLLTTQDLKNPCVQYLDSRRSSLRNRNGQLLKWELQTSNMLSDVCAMLKAKHFVVAGSSMSQNLALVGATLGPRDVYTQIGDFTTDPKLRCKTPNMTLHVFKNNAIDRHGRPSSENGTSIEQTYQSLVNWLQTTRNVSFVEKCP